MAQHEAVSLRLDDLGSRHRNHVLRGLLECVIVRPVGRGRNVPVGERVRVIAAGAGIVPAKERGSGRLPIAELPFPDFDSETGNSSVVRVAR